MKKVRAKIGRPPTEVTEDHFVTIEQMASYGCTHDEIADFLGVSKAVFMSPQYAERFISVTRKAIAARKYELKRKRIESAMEKPHTRTARWVDANILGWSEKQELTGKDGGPLELFMSGVQDLGELLKNLRERDK